MPAGLAQIAAADTPIPVAPGPGATKEEVINTLGWPNGRSSLGPREIYNYPQGQVTLQDGRVEYATFRANAPPKTASPGAPPPTLVKNPEAAAPVWETRFDDAMIEAATRNAPILVLFTASDASPLDRQFQHDVALHPDFARAFSGNYVLLNVDFPTRSEMSALQREQNNQLRQRFA